MLTRLMFCNPNYRRNALAGGSQKECWRTGLANISSCFDKESHLLSMDKFDTHSQNGCPDLSWLEPIKLCQAMSL